MIQKLSLALIFISGIAAADTSDSKDQFRFQSLRKTFLNGVIAANEAELRLPLLKDLKRGKPDIVLDSGPAYLMQLNCMSAELTPTYVDCLTFRGQISYDWCYSKYEYHPMMDPGDLVILSMEHPEATAPGLLKLAIDATTGKLIGLINPVRRWISGVGKFTDLGFQTPTKSYSLSNGASAGVPDAYYEAKDAVLVPWKYELIRRVNAYHSTAWIVEDGFLPDTRKKLNDERVMTTYLREAMHSDFYPGVVYSEPSFAVGYQYCVSTDPRYSGVDR